MALENIPPERARRYAELEARRLVLKAELREVSKEIRQIKNAARMRARRGSK